VHIIKLAKWTLGQVFFVGFWSTQPCQSFTIEEKTLLIPYTHVVQHTFEAKNGVNVWMVQHPNVIYKVWVPFIEYACCACEWALHVISLSTKLLFS
jgi:hypothetical protein